MSSSESLVTRSDHDGICTLSLNRPEALNALSLGVFQDLEAHAKTLAEQTEEIGCVILRGEGRSFSSGNDIKAMQKGEKDPRRHYRTDVIDQLEHLPQPLIASVRGHCYTGALELALVCDLLVASDTARFCDTHAGWQDRHPGHPFDQGVCRDAVQSQATGPEWYRRARYAQSAIRPRATADELTSYPTLIHHPLDPDWTSIAPGRLPRDTLHPWAPAPSLVYCAP